MLNVVAVVCEIHTHNLISHNYQLLRTSLMPLVRQQEGYPFCCNNSQNLLIYIPKIILLRNTVALQSN